jgi:hypothetical protein
VCLPDGALYTFIINHVHISGDGEVAMNNFELTVLLLKAILCGVAAAIVIKFIPFL